MFWGNRNLSVFKQFCHYGRLWIENMGTKKTQVEANTTRKKRIAEEKPNNTIDCWKFEICKNFIAPNARFYEYCHRIACPHQIR